MRYWWVNQNQTYTHEVRGGYLWSPKRKKDGKRNPFYEFMREVAPGDVVFSFADAHIKAIGIARSHAYESPKPKEFGSAGAYWDLIGWRVDVGFRELKFPIRPVDNMGQLAAHLPEQYAPLLASGRGLQSVYLTSLPTVFAEKLLGLLAPEARNYVNAAAQADKAVEPSAAIGLFQWEQHQLEQVANDPDIPETTRESVVLARRGQGKFKENVLKLEKACRVTRVDRIEHLRASHCKPWRDASNAERLNGENGLLLTPTIDHLFDRGFIGFEDNGKLLVSPVAHIESLRKMGIDPDNRPNVGTFSAGQRSFLEFHRENVFLQARVRT